MVSDAERLKGSGMEQAHEAVSHLDAVRAYIMRNRDTTNDLLAEAARDWAGKWYAHVRHIEQHHAEDAALARAERDAKMNLLMIATTPQEATDGRGD